jgi:phage shock protein A
MEVLAGKLAEHQHKAASLDRAVEAFLLDGNESGAAASQSRLNSLGHLVESYTAQLREQERTARQLAEAIAVLDARHHDLKALRAEAQSLLALAHRRTAGRDGAGGASLHELAATSDGELQRSAQRLAAQLKPLRPLPEAAPSDANEQIERVLDRQRVAAQLAERRARLAIGM